MTTSPSPPPLISSTTVLFTSKLQEDDVSLEVGRQHAGYDSDTVASRDESRLSSSCVSPVDIIDITYTKEVEVDEARSSSSSVSAVDMKDVPFMKEVVEDDEGRCTELKTVMGGREAHREEMSVTCEVETPAQTSTPRNDGSHGGDERPVEYETPSNRESERPPSDERHGGQTKRDPSSSGEVPAEHLDEESEEGTVEEEVTEARTAKPKVLFRKVGKIGARESRSVAFDLPVDLKVGVKAIPPASRRLLRRTLSGGKHYSSMQCGEEPQEKRLRFALECEEETEDVDDDSFDHLAPATSPAMSPKPLLVGSDGIRRRRDPRRTDLEDVRLKLTALAVGDNETASAVEAKTTAASYPANKPSNEKTSSPSRFFRFIPLIPADHPLKILWDVLTVILTFVSAYHTHTSIRDRRFVMEELDGSVGWYTAVAAAMEYWFLVDVLLNFITEHKTSEGLVIRDHGGVWGRYLTSWFVVDALSLVPWERVYIQPIIERQNRRGFFPKIFFRTRAVVKVTRRLTRRIKWWRPRRAVRGFASLTKLIRNLLSHARRIGISGPRRLIKAVRYIPKYVLFFRNMKGILAVRVLRLVHFCRRLARDCFVKTRGEFNRRRRRLSSRILLPFKQMKDGDDDTMTTMDDYETDREDEVRHDEYEMY